jgi:hypothetical protein
MADDVRVDLSADEALVIFEWLYRQQDRPDGDFQDQSEQRALWNLVAVLETKVPVLSERYAELLANARERVRDSTD